MIDKDRLIVKAICQAQIASDAGKYQHWLYLHNGASRFAHRYGYAVKPSFIMKAIKLIETNRRGIVNYYVEKGDDQNGYMSILVYFDIRVDDRRYQVSFHTPYNKAPKELKDKIGKGRKTRWAKETCGSARACLALVEYFNLSIK